MQEYEHKTPGKLWIQVLTNLHMRNTWLKLARRDPKSLSTNTRLYFCEDHFDLENDMENYTKYKIMGSVKRIRMKPNCTPSRFDCQPDRKRKSAPSKPRHAFIKRQRMSIIKEIEESIDYENYIESLPSCSQDFLIFENKCDKAVQVVQAQEHKAIQVCRMAHYRSKCVQISIRNKDSMTSPFKPTLCTATSPSKISEGSTHKLCTSTLSVAKRKLNFVEHKYESDESYTPSIVGSTVDYMSSPSKISFQSKTTSDTSSQEEFKKVEKKNLLSTLSKITNKPRSYIRLPKELYFLIDSIEKYTKVSEQNIVLCLMRIKLNRTFSQLADDFNLSVTQASNIFFNKMPEIVKVLSPFIKQFSTKTIKKNLPIAFRHNYNQVTCIIDCLEIEIQKPKKAMHQALTWSEYKKTNTIKYLLACTPDGLVSFVSPGYAGRICDVNLVEHSKFLDTLPLNACILADRGFKHLEHFLSQRGFTSLRPPSVTTGSKLTKAEARQTKQIASLRIHVERVIRRLREFGMLKMHSVININLIGMLDLSITTACALINLQDAIIK